MQTLKEKQSIYNIEPVDAIITEHVIIPGINGRKINLEKSYNNMKRINSFQESLLVFDEIKPSKTIDDIYDKVIVSGNQNINKVSIVLENDSNYCFTENLDIKKECKNKRNIHVVKISNNYLSKIKETIHNGIVYYLELKNNSDLNIIIKYITNNNYEIVKLPDLIK